MTDQTNELLGERIKAARTKKGLTQAQFSELGGANHRSQSLYEKGKQTPPPDYFLRLKENGISIARMIHGTHVKDAVKSAAKPDTLGDRLRDLRKSRGETMQQFADAFGFISRNMVQHQETNNRRPTAEYLKVLHENGIDVEALLTDTHYLGDPDRAAADLELLARFKAAVNMSTSGAILFKLRTDSGMTTEQFGNLGGVTAQTQSSYERDHHSPSLAYLTGLRKNGIDITDLVGNVLS